MTQVIMRFRNEKIAIAADIEEMVMQVKVPLHDRESLRFLWWKDNDLSKPVVEYRMTVHPFGDTSSSFCSNCALRHGKDYSDNAFEAILKKFYVDDLLLPTKLSVSSLLRKPGFHLRKSASNNRETLSEVPLVDLSKSNVPLAEGSSHIKRTLGLQ